MGCVESSSFTGDPSQIKGSYSSEADCNKNCGTCTSHEDCGGVCVDTATAFGCYCTIADIGKCGGGLSASASLEYQCAAAGGTFTPAADEYSICLCIKRYPDATQETCPTLPPATDYSGSNGWSPQICCGGNCINSNNCCNNPYAVVYWTWDAAGNACGDPAGCWVPVDPTGTGQDPCSLIACGSAPYPSFNGSSDGQTTTTKCTSG